METHLVAIAAGLGLGESTAALAFGVMMLLNGFGITTSGENATFHMLTRNGVE